MDVRAWLRPVCRSIYCNEELSLPDDAGTAQHQHDPARNVRVHSIGRSLRQINEARQSLFEFDEVINLTAKTTVPTILALMEL